MLALALLACEPVVVHCDGAPHDSDSEAPSLDTARPDTGLSQPEPMPDPVDDPVQPEPPCGPAAAAGTTWTIWPDAHTGDEHTTQPRTDAHDGVNGDNPEFRRHNVARAHLSYWYTSSHQDPGEPDPNGDQWVDYAPDFAALGAGRWEIIAHYRQTENRAPYEALYIVRHGDDTTVIGRDQRQGDDYESFSLGVFDLCPTDFVRVQDPGPNSISFNQMEFNYVGPSQ